MGRKFIVLDTEGVDTVKHSDNQPHPETSLFYDFGFIVADREGNIYEEKSFINTDVFFKYDDKGNRIMDSAYYANKLPQYYVGMGEEWDLANTKEIWVSFKDAILRYGVRDIWAYNVRYDMLICDSTLRHMSNGFSQWFKPFKCNYRDIWDYAGSTICNTKKYVKWCGEHGFISEKGNPRTNADTVAKYVYGELSFEERHTALDDCQCELDILLQCFKRHQKARKSMGQGWRDAANVCKELRDNERMV